MKLLRRVDKIVWHCSDLSYGTVEGIRRYHKSIGWADCGYHYVMHNGLRRHKAAYDMADDGRMYEGRRRTAEGYFYEGAHVRGYNSSSIGLCWIGRRPTVRQLTNGLTATKTLLEAYDLTPDDVLGHYELDPQKTCPNQDMGLFRDALRAMLK